MNDSLWDRIRYHDHKPLWKKRPVFDGAVNRCKYCFCLIAAKPKWYVWVRIKRKDIKR